MLTTVKVFHNKSLSLFYRPSQALPNYNIKVSQDQLDKLTENLPISGQDYRTANIILPNGDKFNGEVRFRGGHYWHWGNPKKSWRLKYKNKDDQTVKINLINSRAKNQIVYSLGYYLGEQAGLLSPDTKFVTVSINDVYQGVYESVEQVDQNFLANH